MDLNIGLVAAVVIVGIAVGAMSAAFGVGGGVIMVPFIVAAFDEPQQVAEGTSLLVIVPTAIAGVIAHRKRGFVDVQAALPIAAAGLVGAVGGALIALALDPADLQRVFGAFTILVGVKLLRDGVRARRGRDPSRVE